jgi:hypothetical protein
MDEREAARVEVPQEAVEISGRQPAVYRRLAWHELTPHIVDSGAQHRAQTAEYPDLVPALHGVAIPPNADLVIPGCPVA